jgi:N-acetylglutamate synthase-like GNAT family acetyltransferase
VAADGSRELGVSTRLSQRLWGIDWQNELPIAVTQDGRVRAEFSTLVESLPFINAHYRSIFEHNAASPFQAAGLTDAKATYYREVADFFEFKCDGRTVGLLIGTPVDWSSYYLRSAAVLPEVQGKKIIQRFLPLLFERLRVAGVERIEADTSPSNMATLHLLTRLRFNVTGTALTERWGANVHFTKFLSDDGENIFLRQYCSGVTYQLRERERERDDQ